MKITMSVRGMWPGHRTLEDDRFEEGRRVDPTPHPHFHSHGGQRHAHDHSHVDLTPDQAVSYHEHSSRTDQ